MSINNNNIWELAEGYLAGSIPQPDFLKLKERLSADAAFAAEFYEATDLIRSMEDGGKQRRFRGMLRDIHQEKVQKQETKKAKLIWLTPQLWRTATIAAAVALVISTITVVTIKPSINKNESQYNTINRAVTDLKKAQAQQAAQQKQLKLDLDKTKKFAPPPSDVKYSGTGFALTNDGYFVTAYHVIYTKEDGYGDSVYILNRDGQYFKASLVNFNADADIAILKVERSGFKFAKGELPYTFTAAKAGLGAQIFTLGYPNDDIVYSEGYISAKNGFAGNALQYTLELPAGHGQSGSPVIDEKGTVLGLLTAVGSPGESNTYAVGTKALLDLVQTLPNSGRIHLAKSAKLAKLNREQQIEKMEAYTFSVKVYKK
jgi:serine protease Do